MRKREYDISYFVCPKCRNSLPLPRSKGRKREKGHIKNLYCVYCDEVVKTTEIRSGDCYVNNDEELIYV